MSGTRKKVGWMPFCVGRKNKYTKLTEKLFIGLWPKWFATSKELCKYQIRMHTTGMRFKFVPVFVDGADCEK